MTKTNYHYFDGIADYVRTNTPDAYGNFTVKLVMTDDEVDKYEATGIQVAVGDDNGVFFRRPHKKIINNELQDLGPPLLVDSAGEDLPDQKIMIGKGSKLTLKVTSYPTMKGTGHTLQAVQVHDLVPVKGVNGDRRNF